jgi:hypothetical protein
MGKIIRRIPGTPLSAEAKVRVEKLKDLPDSEIDLTDAPEWTEDRFAGAFAGREIRWRGEAAQFQKKAS